MSTRPPKPTDPVIPHGPIPDLPRSPEQPVVPPDDPNRDDVDREPSIDPPAGEPPVQAPSEKPLIEEPPRPRASGMAGRAVQGDEGAPDIVGRTGEEMPEARHAGIDNNARSM
jgi:hypothetical protein